MDGGARYAQSPRAAQLAEDENKKTKKKVVMMGRSLSSPLPDDAYAFLPGAGQPPLEEVRRRKGCLLLTTDLDELPDYMNLPVPSSPIYQAHLEASGGGWNGGKVFTNQYGREENIYEEINELQRRLALGRPVAMATRHPQQHHGHLGGPHHHHHHQQRSGCTSAVDEALLNEVDQVRLRHDTIISELNLELEQFLKPQTPEPPPMDPAPMEEGHHHHHLLGREELYTPPLSTSSRSRKKFIPSHFRSGSTTSAIQLPDGRPPPPPLVRSESLDLMMGDGGLHRRSSVGSRGSTSTTSSTRSDSAFRQHSFGGFVSRSHIQQGIQRANQGLAEFSEKCGLLLAKRSKKVIALVHHKDRRSTCDADCSSPSSVIPPASSAAVVAASPTQSSPVRDSTASSTDVVDSESRIYEDIDDSAVTTGSFGDQKLVLPPHHPNSSLLLALSDVDSGEFESCTSSEDDGEEELEGDKSHSPTTSNSSLRALLSGKSIRNRLRGSRERSQRRSREEESKALLVTDGGVSTTPPVGSSSCSSVGPAGHHRMTSPQTGERRFSRLFSLRRSLTASTLPSPTSSTLPSASSSASTFTLNCPAQDPSPLSGSSPVTTTTAASFLPRLAEERDDELLARMEQAGLMGTGTLFQRRHQPPTLPPMPANLTQEQIKRRYIVATIIHSENSYVASLQRLVNDYKKPLEESSPAILSSGKIGTLFHRVPEILQCHSIFRLALAECARSWDREEKIGDVFVANFSKANVLDIYSDFINNFSVAVDLAKQESKRKSALADFLKVKQISSHDRLSFFGLLVKPVQRFPQFILLLQDLLKHTPQGHPDRMTLQLALTQLESLAELLNERKRESEQYQAFRETLRRVSGKFSLRPLADSNRYLLRQDNAHLVEFNGNGMISKTKERRLLLLNDLLVCVSVASKSRDDDFRSGASSERLTLKWAVPITDVEVEDTSTSPTLSRLLSAGSSANLRSSEAINGVDNLCQEMNQLMHDYDVITRIGSLMDSLHGYYESLDRSATRAALARIQQQLQQKDEEMAWIDSCCLQLVVRSRSGKEERFTFQTESPDIRKDWVIELRLAQLAMDPKNSPSWDVPEQERRPSTKMPLFVKSMPVHRSNHETEVRCGCFYTAMVQKTGPSVRYLGPRAQNFLWIVASDGISSHVTLLTSQQPVGPSLKEAAAFSLVEVRVTSAEFAPGAQLRFDSSESDGLHSERVRGDLVWLGTESRRILLYSAQEPDRIGQVGSLSLPASVVQLRYHWDQMFVALANGTVAIFKRNVSDGSWDLNAPATLVTLGEEPVVSLLPIGSALYAACGHSVHVLDGLTGESLRSFSVRQEHSGTIQAMAHSGIGLWISLRQSSTICLYHTETFRHLQDINVASNVNRLMTSGSRTGSGRLQPVYVTALMASKGLLWVGTNVGIALSIPLPRLEGVPIISGRANVSHHAHSGPITFFLTLQMPAKSPPPPLATPPLPSAAIPIPPPASVTIHEESEGETTSSPSSMTAEKVPAQTLGVAGRDKLQLRASSSFESPLMIRRRNREMTTNRLSRTLPRGHVASLTAAECDIFGLYGELMNVKDFEAEGDGVPGGSGVHSGAVGSMYETLRRSDPDLAAIPAKVSTLDRRLHMKASRPRSLDLSNWSVDSRSSLYTTSSGSEDSASHHGGSTLTPGSTLPSSSMSSATVSTLKRDGQQHQQAGRPGHSSSSGPDAPRTVLTLSGGRGYVYPLSSKVAGPQAQQPDSTEQRKSSVPSPGSSNNGNDAHIILWEMKL